MSNGKFALSPHLDPDRYVRLHERASAAYASAGYTEAEARRLADLAVAAAIKAFVEESPAEVSANESARTPSAEVVR